MSHKPLQANICGSYSTVKSKNFTSPWKVPAKWYYKILVVNLIGCYGNNNEKNANNAGNQIDQPSYLNVLCE